MGFKSILWEPQTQEPNIFRYPPNPTCDCATTIEGVENPGTSVGDTATLVAPPTATPDYSVAGLAELATKPTR